jgi:hypothetical protein
MNDAFRTLSDPNASFMAPPVTGTAMVTTRTNPCLFRSKPTAR